VKYLKKITILLFALVVFSVMVNIVEATRPGKTSIILLNEPSGGYRLGDTVEILLTAEANQVEGWGGDKDIAEFLLYAYYDSMTNMEYEGEKTATQTGDGKFKAEFSFTLTERQDATLTIEGRAFDTEMLPGDVGITAIYVYPRHNPENDDSGNEVNTNNNQQTDSTPSFEILLMITSIALILVWKKQRVK